MIDIYGKDNNKNKVIEILSTYPNSTAKQIYYKLKSKYGINITYQGAHKLINELVEGGVLEKDKKEYSINLSWIDRIQYLSSNIRKKLLNSEIILSKAKSAVKSIHNQNIKIISFDQTGSIFDNSFDELLWYNLIPEVYSNEHKVPFDVAHEKVNVGYRENWDIAGGEWRNPKYWINLFELRTSFEEMARKIDDHIKPYADSLKIIKKLSKKYKLIIVSNAHRVMLEHKLKISKLDKYFFNTYSISSDFNMMGTTGNVFKELCQHLGIKPTQLVHIGNKYDEDYQIPSSIGVKAFLIDRSGRKKETYVMRDLYEFKSKIKELELRK